MRRKIGIIFLIFVIIFCLYGCNSKEEKVKKLLDSGATKVEVGDYRGAIEDYDKAIEINPTFVYANPD